MSKELPENIRELLRYINETPALLSLLYDIDMLPEQLTEMTKPWGDMLIISEHFRWHSDKCRAESDVLKSRVRDYLARPSSDGRPIRQDMRKELSVSCQ